MKHDPILAADRMEEQAAHDELRAVATQAELISVWNRSCDHFTGAARERLSDTYRDKLLSMGALAP